MGTTACASDSPKFGARYQNLRTEWPARYLSRGVMIYWHVDRKSTCIYSQLKRCSSSEVAAMIEGVLRLRIHRNRNSRQIPETDPMPKRVFRRHWWLCRHALPKDDAERVHGRRCRSGMPPATLIRGPWLRRESSTQTPSRTDALHRRSSLGRSRGQSGLQGWCDNRRSSGSLLRRSLSGSC